MDIAKALAELHGLGGGEYSPVIHTDIKPEQFLMIDGQFKLNDFNLAKLIKFDKSRDEACPAMIRYSGFTTVRFLLDISVLKEGGLFISDQWFVSSLFLKTLFLYTESIDRRMSIFLVNTEIQ